MSAFNRKAFFDAARPMFGGRLSQAQVDALGMALDAGLGVVHHNPTGAEPAWLGEGRKDLGVQEIPGKAHAPRILKMLAALKYPFSDDETPWCGTAMAAWMKQAGIDPPPAGYRALNWAGWGVECPAQVGAIGIKARPGGNHVFIIVGETADKRCFKALGANQRNAVTIMDVPKSEVSPRNIRWPAGVAQPNIPLPVMAAGTISRNEV